MCTLSHTKSCVKQEIAVQDIAITQVPVGQPLMQYLEETTRAMECRCRKSSDIAQSRYQRTNSDNEMEKNLESNESLEPSWR